MHHDKKLACQYAQSSLIKTLELYQSLRFGVWNTKFEHIHNIT